MLIQPGTCPLDAPAFGQHLKARQNGQWLLTWPNPNAFDADPPRLNDRDLPIDQVLSRPGPKATVGAAIGPRRADSREAFWHIVHDRQRAIANTDGGRVNLMGKQQALRVYNHMSLAPIGFLPPSRPRSGLPTQVVLTR